MEQFKLETTFNLLRESGMRPEGLNRLAQHLGGVEEYGADKPINLLTVLESNGIDDTTWSLRATIQDSGRASVALAVAFAESILEKFEAFYPDDDRPRAAIEAAKGWLVSGAADNITKNAWDTWAAWAITREKAAAAAWEAWGADAGAAGYAADAAGQSARAAWLASAAAADTVDAALAADAAVADVYALGRADEAVNIIRQHLIA